MSTTRNYKQVNANDGPVWNPKAETLDGFNPEDKANNIIEGYLIDVKHDVGINKSTIYKVHEVLADGTFGEEYSIWSNAVLAGSLDNLDLGTFVCIEYKGFKVKKNMEGRPFKAGTTHYHNWAVFTDDNAVPYKKALSISRGETAETVEEAKAPVSSRQPATSAPKGFASARSSRQAAPAKGSNPFSEDDLPF